MLRKRVDASTRCIHHHLAAMSRMRGLGEVEGLGEEVREVADQVGTSSMDGLHPVATGVSRLIVAVAVLAAVFAAVAAKEVAV